MEILGRLSPNSNDTNMRQAPIHDHNLNFGPREYDMLLFLEFDSPVVGQEWSSILSPSLIPKQVILVKVMHRSTSKSKSSF